MNKSRMKTLFTTSLLASSVAFTTQAADLPGTG